ncbi:MAG: family 20 glycosylhydrolase [Caldilineaceae bacterium]
MPQKVVLTGGALRLGAGGRIALQGAQPADLLFVGQQLQVALDAATASHWRLGGGTAGAVTLVVAPAIGRQEGYILTVAEDGIVVAGDDLAGVFYGVMTLKQLLQTESSTLPLLRIEDWPDYPARGVMLDVSRDAVPTMESLYELIDKLASWKVNQFQLYTEHTFAYQQHRVVWQSASPFTAEEILALDAFCRQRFVELVPNQNSFGHMDRWVKHPAYLHLGETEPGTMRMWGQDVKIPFSLAPVVPETVTFLDALYGELLPNFTSRLFNVNCDETFDLGQGRSQALVAAKGKGRVYLEFLLKLYELVKARGRTMQYWGDIINQYPALVPELPKDAIALEWGYDFDHDYPGKTKLFADAGVPYYVCPGTSAWWSILGRTDNCIANIREAARCGLTNGAIGLLNTDWGDTAGFRHYLPVSYLGFAYGAAVSWALLPNQDIDVPACLDQFVFQDRAGKMGQIAYDLGNAYQKTGVRRFDGSILYSLYPQSLAEVRDQMVADDSVDEQSKATLLDDKRLRANLQATIEYIDGVVARSDSAQMACPDAALIKREFLQMARMAQHGASRGLLQLADHGVTPASLSEELALIESEYPGLWLARRRPGGLMDSFRRIQESRDLYS